ncbi:hypothetical protein A2335_00385 [Candidatus Peregrinibacteria bacterium RIFOXYB2_FULL_32_7]|nr:MAG: hypothetical protein A2335_00385 [Candidatus Peregrinibacteria bacterium RIFOXYB2_FULL_32_7]
MNSSCVTSCSINYRNYEFLKVYPNKSKVINEALEAYRKYVLKKQMQEGFAAQDEEDLELANSDFNDYLSIIEASENDDEL